MIFRIIQGVAVISYSVTVICWADILHKFMFNILRGRPILCVDYVANELTILETKII